MIKRSGRASRFIVYTAGVKLERVVGSINGYGNWLLIGSSHESRFRSRGNVLEVRDGVSNVRRGILTVIRTSGSVWVAIFSINTIVGDDILESLIH
jgi:hypothetical protein